MIKGTPSREQVGKVLDRLATDPAFREKLLGDPKAALAEHGIEVDESKIPAVRSLPPMEDILQNKEAYADKFGNELGFDRFFLR